LLRPGLQKVRFLWLHLGFIAARITYGGILGVGQYIYWAGNPFTAPLTYLPLPPDVPLPGLLKLFAPLLALRHGYFVDYMLSHYWMGLLWGLAVSVLLFIFLRTLRKIRPMLLSALDIHLFVAGSLIVTWPNTLLYIVIVFFVFLLHVLFTTIMRGGRTPLYPSILIGFLIIFFLGDRVAAFFPVLEVLKFTRT
jgi:hypothetical protein